MTDSTIIYAVKICGMVAIGSLSLLALSWLSFRAWQNLATSARAWWLLLSILLSKRRHRLLIRDHIRQMHQEAPALIEAALREIIDSKPNQSRSAAEVSREQALEVEPTASGPIRKNHPDSPEGMRHGDHMDDHTLPLSLRRDTNEPLQAWWDRVEKLHYHYWECDFGYGLVYVGPPAEDNPLNPLPPLAQSPVDSHSALQSAIRAFLSASRNGDPGKQRWHVSYEDMATLASAYQASLLADYRRSINPSSVTE